MKPSSKLQAKWAKILKDSGFNDIEQDEVYFADGKGVSTIDKRRVTWEIQAEYFHLAGNFLNDYRFSNALDKAIWAQHAMSTDGISESFLRKFNAKRKHKIHKLTAWRIIKRLELIMKKKYGVVK